MDNQERAEFWKALCSLDGKDLKQDFSTLIKFKAAYGFADADSIDAAYADAVNVMANMKIINGFADGTFRPNATANRGQAATILYRLYSLINEE